MPITKAAPSAENNLLGERIPEKPTSFVEATGAIFRQENVIANAYDMGVEALTKPDAVPGFDPLTAIPDRYKSYASYFVGVESPEEARAMMYKVDRDVEDHRKFANASVGTQIGAVVAGLAPDPTIWAAAFTPAGIVRAGVAARRVSQIGPSIRRLTAETALAEGAISVGRESVLHQNQPLRTMEQSLMNVAGDAMLSGLFAAPFAMKGIADEFGAWRTSQHRQMMEVDTVRKEPFASAGSMGTDFLAVETDAAIQKWLDFSNQVYDKPLPRWMGMNPLMRMTTNPFQTSTMAANELFNHGLVTPGDIGKTGRPAAEIEVKFDIHQPIAAYTDLFADEFSTLSSRLNSEGRPPMSRNDFDMRVWRAQSNGDVDLDYPEVSRVAQAGRKILDKESRRAVALGRIQPEDMKIVGGAKSWMYRQLNTELITRNQVDWEDFLTDQFTQEYMKQGKPLDKIARADIAANVRATTDTILASPVGRSSIMDIKSPIAKRTLPLSDEVLAPWLISGSLENMNSFLHYYVPDNVMLERFGDDYLPKWQADLAEEFRVMREKLTSNAQRTELDKFFESAKKDLDRSVARVRGRHLPTVGDSANSANKYAGWARTATYMAYMGGMSAAALPDIAFTALFNGFSPTMRGIGQGLSSIAERTIGKNPDAIKKYKQPMRAMAVGVEDATNQQMTALGDLYTPTRTWHAISQKYTKLTGIIHITNAYKYATGYVVQDQLAKIARTGGTDVDRLRLRKMGLTQKDMRILGDQFSKHGEVDRGVSKLNVDAWDPEYAETAQKVRLGTLAEVDRTIVTPGVGDKPLFVDDALQGLLFQFQSFFMASWNQVTVPMLQRAAMGEQKKMATALGIASTLGFSSFALREILAGRGEALGEMSENEMMWHAVDRGGLLSFVMNVAGTADTMSKGALKESLGIDPGRQYRPTVSGSVPALSYLENVYRGAQTAVSGGPETDAQLNNLYKIMPGANLLYVKPGLELMQQQQIESMGLKRTRRTELNKNWRKAQKEVKRLEKQRQKEMEATQ